LPKWSVRGGKTEETRPLKDTRDRNEMRFGRSEKKEDESPEKKGEKEVKTVKSLAPRGRPTREGTRKPHSRTLEKTFGKNFRR